MKLTPTIAERIAARLRRDGFDQATVRDVWDVVNTGSVEPGVVGDEHDAALESRILHELDEYGITVA